MHMCMASSGKLLLVQLLFLVLMEQIENILGALNVDSAGQVLSCVVGQRRSRASLAR